MKYTMYIQLVSILGRRTNWFEKAKEYSICWISFYFNKKVYGLTTSPLAATAHSQKPGKGLKETQNFLRKKRHRKEKKIFSFPQKPDYEGAVKLMEAKGQFSNF